MVLIVWKIQYKPGYKPCDQLLILFHSLAEITAFRLERIFEPMTALEFRTGHVVYNQAYNLILQAKETKLFAGDT